MKQETRKVPSSPDRSKSQSTTLSRSSTKSIRSGKSRKAQRSKSSRQKRSPFNNSATSGMQSSQQLPQQVYSQKQTAKLQEKDDFWNVYST